MFKNSKDKDRLLTCLALVVGILILIGMTALVIKDVKLRSASAQGSPATATNGPLQYPNTFSCDSQQNKITNISGPGSTLPPTILKYTWGCYLPIDTAAAGHLVYCLDNNGQPMNGNDVIPPTGYPYTLYPGQTVTLPMPGNWGTGGSGKMWELHYTVHTLDSNGVYYGAGWDVYCNISPTPSPGCP